MVIVSRWPVVVIRVIVPRVLVDVQRRGYGRRHGQSLHEHESDEPAHEDSLLRPALLPWKGERFARSLAG